MFECAVGEVESLALWGMEGAAFYYGRVLEDLVFYAHSLQSVDSSFAEDEVD